MNERIKELAEEAGVIFVPSSKDYFGQYFPSDILTDKIDLNKFAELIIRECAGVAWGIYANQEIANGIKEHFGVE